MASKVIYPPIVNSYIPAFQNGQNAVCRVYFSLSKFNSRSDFQSVHISVTKQDSGASVVYQKDAPPRYRATGIILNAEPVKVEDSTNLYYVDILAEDVKQSENDKDPWKKGWIYKIQIRLSAVNYNDATIKQASWLNAQSNNFSEWSTVCLTKVIGKSNITIPQFGYSTDDKPDEIVLYTSTLDITGTYSNEDLTEMLYSYKVKLLYENNVIEESDILYSNQYINSNQFAYTFNHNLNEGNYTLCINYETNNKFTSQEEINFLIVYHDEQDNPFQLITAETGAETSLYEEEEEGRIGLQLLLPQGKSFNGDLYIRRTSSDSNFQIWEDVKILTINKTAAAADIKLPIIYDYTAISGYQYLYGIQTINEYGNRGIIKTIDSPIVRDYCYSYLLGPGEQQLKLKFDNTITNYKVVVGDTKTDTIGGRYPFITRNGNMRYKSFNISGLISYNMDEAHLFINKDFIGRESNGLYDYVFEREFRQKVLDFLYSDEPKLFKSPTEGNIIVRLMDIQTTPNKTLNRMIYNFSLNAYEIADATMSNYLTYKITSTKITI